MSRLMFVASIGVVPSRFSCLVEAPASMSNFAVPDSLMNAAQARGVEPLSSPRLWSAPLSRSNLTVSSFP